MSAGLCKLHRGLLALAIAKVREAFVAEHGGRAFANTAGNFNSTI